MVTFENLVAVHTHGNLINNKKDTLSAFSKYKYKTDQ